MTINHSAHHLHYTCVIVVLLPTPGLHGVVTMRDVDGRKDAVKQCVLHRSFNAALSMQGDRFSKYKYCIHR